MKRITLLIITFLWTFTALAQAERSDIRKGNDFFKQGKYPQAETAYKQAIGKNVGSYEGAFNLGGSLYKQQRWEEAAAGYAKLASEKGNSDRQSEAFYNLGNSNVKMRKLQEAIDSYKDALRINPSDAQAKFNLAYAQKLKEEEDKKNNQDQNKDNQDQNNNQNKDNQDQKDDKKDDNKDKNKDKDDKQDPNKDKKDQEKEQPQKQQPNREAQQMLNAVQAAEDKTKEKLDKQKEAEAVGVRGVKQW